MRLKYTFEKMKLDDQIIAVPVGENSEEFHGIVKLNDTAEKIFDLLKEDISEQEIVNILNKEYEVSVDLLKEDVRQYVAYFQEKGLIVQ